MQSRDCQTILGNAMHHLFAIVTHAITFSWCYFNTWYGCHMIYMYIYAINYIWIERQHKHPATEHSILGLYLERGDVVDEPVREKGDLLIVIKKVEKQQNYWTSCTHWDSCRNFATIIDTLWISHHYSNDIQMLWIGYIRKPSSEMKNHIFFIVTCLLILPLIYEICD